MKRLQIFRVGKHVAANGKSIDFTEAQLKAAAEAYDPKLHEAPITIGHPKGNAPAYGWIGKLSFAEGNLEADPTQVDPQFAELVKEGKFKKVSASFYEPDAPQNPKPGVYYIRHLAFLGAQPPAVKGLRAVDFSDSEKGVLEFADMTWSWALGTMARVLRRMRDWIIAERGLEKADELLPPWEVESLERAAAEESAKAAPLAASFSEEELDMDKEELARREAEIGTKEKNIAEREGRVQKQEADARHKTHVEFAESLVKDGRLLPVHAGGVVALMDALPATGTIEFGEGDKKQTPNTVTWLQDFLKTQPKVVDFKERAGADKSGEQLDTTDADAIAAKAVEFKESEAKAGRTISVTEAVAHVTKGAKE